MKDALKYGQLNVSGATLSGTTTEINNVVVQYTGGYFPTGTYTIYSNTLPFTTTPTASPPPSNTLFFSFATPVVTTNAITIAITAIPLQNLAIGSVNKEIASVLQAMGQNIANAGQMTLLDAIVASPNQAAYNYNLNQLRPNVNAANSTIAVQNNLFSKVDARIITRRDGLSSETGGIASGDLSPNCALWMGGFGSIAKQKARNQNPGYRARAVGGIFGIDRKSCDDDLIGMAFAFSNSNVYEISNNNFTTRLLGYHGLIYGNQNFLGDTFLEWLLSGTFNKNHSTRPVNLNGQNFAVSATFHGWQAAGQFNFGKFVDVFDWFRFTHVLMLEYTFLHDPPYTETGSAAALYVANDINRSILTPGTGVRISFQGDDPWLTGPREIHAYVTYDTLSANNVTTANFTVGSNAFTITDNPPRLAFIAGVDYSLNLCWNLQLQLSYNYEYRTGYYDNSGEAKLRWLF